MKTLTKKSTYHQLREKIAEQGSARASRELQEYSTPGVVLNYEVFSNPSLSVPDFTAFQVQPSTSPRDWVQYDVQSSVTTNVNQLLHEIEIKNIDQLNFFIELTGSLSSQKLTQRIRDLWSELQHESSEAQTKFFQSATAFAILLFFFRDTIPPLIGITPDFDLQGYWQGVRGETLTINFQPNGRINYGVISYDPWLPQNHGMHQGVASLQAFLTTTAHSSSFKRFLGTPLGSVLQTFSLSNSRWHSAPLGIPTKTR